MKAKLNRPEGMNNWVTIAELPFVRKLLKNPGTMLGFDNPDDWFTFSIDILQSLFGGGTVITASAEIGKNERANDSLCADSGKFDIWFTALIETWIPEYSAFGYIKASAYYTDLMQINPDNRNELMRHMYIRKFKEVE